MAKYHALDKEVSPKNCLQSENNAFNFEENNSCKQKNLIDKESLFGKVQLWLDGKNLLPDSDQAENEATSSIYSNNIFNICGPKTFTDHFSSTDKFFSSETDKSVN